MAERTPLFMDISSVYSGDELGLPLRHLVGEGIRLPGDLAVSGGAGNTVNIAAGGAYVLGDTDTNFQPCYYCHNDAVKNLGITPDPSLPRYVLIIAQAIDAGFSGGSRQWQLQALHGTPSIGPAVPATPASALALATVLVPAAAASSAAYTITNLNPFAIAGGGQLISGAKPISDTLLAAAAASIDIQNIPASFRHLLLVGYFRDTSGNSVDTLLARLNNDSGANYDDQRMNASAGTVSAGELFGQTSADVGQATGGAATANQYAPMVLFIPHYANATQNKALLSLQGNKSSALTGGLTIAAKVAFWRSNAAINRLTLTPAAGSLALDSRATLYGLP